MKPEKYKNYSLFQGEFRDSKTVKITRFFAYPPSRHLYPFLYADTLDRLKKLVDAVELYDGPEMGVEEWDAYFNGMGLLNEY